MATKSGVIEVVARTGKSFKIDGQWYGAFAKSQIGSVNSGDLVTFDYTSVDKGGTVFHNIKGNVRTDGAGASGGGDDAPTPTAKPASGGYSRGGISFPLAPLDGQRVIVRQNALAHATKLFVETGRWGEETADFDTAPDLIIELARKFESYVAGDLDMAEAKASLE